MDWHLVNRRHQLQCRGKFLCGTERHRRRTLCRELKFERVELTGVHSNSGLLLQHRQSSSKFERASTVWSHYGRWEPGGCTRGEDLGRYTRHGDVESRSGLRVSLGRNLLVRPGLVNRFNWSVAQIHDRKQWKCL